MKTKFAAIGLAMLCISVLFASCGSKTDNATTNRGTSAMTNVSTTTADAAGSQPVL